VAEFSFVASYVLRWMLAINTWRRKIARQLHNPASLGQQSTCSCVCWWRNDRCWMSHGVLLTVFACHFVCGILLVTTIKTGDLLTAGDYTFVFQSCKTIHLYYLHITCLYQTATVLEPGLFTLSVCASVS